MERGKPLPSWTATRARASVKVDIQYVFNMRRWDNPSGLYLYIWITESGTAGETPAIHYTAPHTRTIVTRLESSRGNPCSNIYKYNMRPQDRTLPHRPRAAGDTPAALEGENGDTYIYNCIHN